ncbi:MAG: glycosyltransferase family 2 protein [Nitrospiria bacterium]
MISVIISTYNRPERLQKAIKSVLGQTYKDFELIVVHDGIIDPDSELNELMVKYVNDKRISFYGMPHFGNDTKPKNFGIFKSKGDYISFLDDDNEYLPDHLMALVKFAEQNPDTDIVYGDRMVVHDDDKDFEPSVGVASDFNSALLVDRNFIDTSDVLVKREALFYVGGWDERYRKYVDWNLWVRLNKAQFKFKHLAKVITTYHLHKDMKSLTVFNKGERVGDKPFGNSNPINPFKPEWNFFDLEIRLPYLGEIPAPKVAVFTLTMNRLELTKVMFKSLLKAGYPFDWYVVDNGSTDGTVEWLKSLGSKPNYPSIKLIFNEKNKGISIGSNQALDAMGDNYDYIIKLDNDAEVLTNKWLAILVDIYKIHNSMILSPYVEGLVDNPGGSPRLTYKNMRKHTFGLTKHIGGIFTMAHKSAYKDFRWDEEDTLHSLQDTVFCQEMQKKDFVICYVEDMRVMHQLTTKGQQDKYPDYFRKRVFERTHTYK